jgi:hypothetical protein
MAFGSPIYEGLRALGFNNVFEVNFGLTHTPDRAKANMRAHLWDRMKDWLLTGAVEPDEKMAMDLASPGYHINRSNLLALESKADMQKRGQASPDDVDALALTFAQAVAPAEVEERDEDDEDGAARNRYRVNHELATQRCQNRSSRRPGPQHFPDTWHDQGHRHHPRPNGSEQTVGRYGRGPAQRQDRPPPPRRIGNRPLHRSRPGPHAMGRPPGIQR